MPKDTPPSVLMRTPHQRHTIFVLISSFAALSPNDRWESKFNLHSLLMHECQIFLANVRILDLSDCMGPRAHEASIASPDAT